VEDDDDLAKFHHRLVKLFLGVGGRASGPASGLSGLPPSPTSCPLPARLCNIAKERDVLPYMSGLFDMALEPGDTRQQPQPQLTSGVCALCCCFLDRATVHPDAQRSSAASKLGTEPWCAGLCTHTKATVWSTRREWWSVARPCPSNPFRQFALVPQFCTTLEPTLWIEYLLHHSDLS
jgi:hypothetical protein